MHDFTFYNPTRLVLGRGTIARLPHLVPEGARILLTYGGGSIKRNGVYAQVREALEGREIFEFGGIEPNPEYETLLRGVARAREEQADFLLAVGGGSVFDGTKFIAAAARWPGDDPWEILKGHGRGVVDAVPMGGVLTLPATGSEANGGSVVSRRATGEKTNFIAEAVYPVFSILDPETTYTLPAHQVRNGIVDAYVHVMEQYATYPAEAPLQDRQSEAILATLVESAPAILRDPPDYPARATLMWCATQALNGLVGAGVPQDWATHMIGHELTALYGLDHGVTLAIVLPGVLRHQIDKKRAKLVQYGERIFGTSDPEEAIQRTDAFFRSVGMPTLLSEYGVDAAEAADRVGQRLAQRGARLGEHRDIDAAAAAAILTARA